MKVRFHGVVRSNGRDRLTATLDPLTAETAAAALRRLPMKDFTWRCQLLIDEADRQGVRPPWYPVLKRRLRDDRLRQAVRPYVPEAAHRLRRSLRRLSSP